MLAWERHIEGDFEMFHDYTPEDIARFWSKVNPSTEDGCWDWTANHSSKGYGLFWFGGGHGSPIGSHRVAYELTFGEIPEGLYVCHHCDNPQCVNPNHLFLGTPADNTQDMLKKRRNKAGETHYMSTLSDKEVSAIKTLYEGGGITQKQLAQRFGVSQSTISNIVRGRTR
jgi:DNA-binding XRE family transcriptional regulator